MDKASRVMNAPVNLVPLGVSITGYVEQRGKSGRCRARVRWTDPATKSRDSKSESFDTREVAESWIDLVQKAAARGVDPRTATATLADYGNLHWDTAMRGIEPKTLDGYRAGWRLRIVTTLGHIPVTMITNCLADRAVSSWIAAGCGRSTIKNTLAALGRVLDQAVRDEVIDRNRVKVTRWQAQLERFEDELDDPRSLALPDRGTLERLAAALVAASAGEYQGWGDAVIFAACTASRIGEVSGCRIRDIDRAVGLDTATSDDAGAGWAQRQRHEGEAGADRPDHRTDSAAGAGTYQ